MNVQRAFSEPVHDAQAAYRALLAAMAEPFLPVLITALPTAPASLTSACAAACLTLLDNETAVWLQPSFDASVRRWLSFHTQCAFVEDPARAQFALIGDPRELPGIDAFNCGNINHPESSTTLFMQIQSFEGGLEVRAHGPGIAGERALRPRTLGPEFWQQWSESSRGFPLGVDAFLFADTGVAGLPRATRIELGAP
jgi:alpha-D-ribose 1-methylphosphonate 5-triphosphate synthase subunit PhnH